MKLVTKKPEEIKEKIDNIETELQKLDRHLYIECNKCDGTGQPKTKLGIPPIAGTGNTKCKECGGTGRFGSKIGHIEVLIDKIRKEVARLNSTLNAHINKQAVEIRVLPEGHDPSKQGENGWEDYSGSFSIDNEEEKSIVIGKARYHFETYFKDSVYHRNKRLGLFLSNPRSGKHLIEEIETGD